MSLHIEDTSNRGKLSNETINQLFSQLKAEDIEQFYMAYQLWSQQQQVEQLQLQMLSLQRKIAENSAHMAQFQPSAIALASLAQLQACGVEDTDLLDRMLERGEEWLDHSIQLLERCEQLDLIGGNYTQWCTHALEGAYDWLDSITDPSEVADPITHENTMAEGAEVTEEQLLQKLMSEGGADEKAGQTQEQKNRITQPLTIVDEQDGTGDETQKVAAIKPLKRVTQPLPAADEPAVPDEQVETSSSVPAETEQNPGTATITTTEINQEEPTREESAPVAIQVDIAEVSDQEPHPTNIEENEINIVNSTEQEGEEAPLPPIVENEAQGDDAVVIERIDQDKSRNDTEQRADEENQQQVQLQGLPASKKNVSKRRKGFLRWLLAKILRR